MKIKKISEVEYEIEKEGKMNVPVRIFASEAILNKLKEDNSLQQGINVASLPGILGKSVMMPDAHQGYGFSIGGVAAFDAETGLITPGGIGFDINCGVRLLTTNLTKEEVEPKIKEILEALFKHVPSGVGSESKLKLSKEELDDVLNRGCEWTKEKGYATAEDLDFCEENGRMKDADAKEVSKKAKQRGTEQLGTLGAGNHFLEIQYVDNIFDEKTSKVFGIEKKNQICVMIHCGSRGLGHQVCSDFLREMEDAYPDVIEKLPEKDLIYAPANSELAKRYYKAMCASANFAWANRQLIAYHVRLAFKEIFPNSVLKPVYDVAHNIAKKETHTIDGKKRLVYLHRKGATRAFGAGNEELPEKYKKFGQPVLIPGSMGTSSYVLLGNNKSMEESFGSTAHGSGRVMSRHAALASFRGEDVKKDLEKNHIYIKSASLKGIAEEAPQVYKNVDEVVDVSDKAGIASTVVRLKPLGVIKG